MYKPGLAYIPVVMWMLVGLALAGCVQVEVVGGLPSPGATSSATVATPSPPTSEHDVAVLAVDFEPALEYEHIISDSEGITLLVAVENTGLWAEIDVQVEARLSSYKSDDPILEDVRAIDAIAPGEIKIVRSKTPSRIPYRPAYRLRVHVLPDARWDVDFSP